MNKIFLIIKKYMPQLIFVLFIVNIGLVAFIVFDKNSGFFSEKKEKKQLQVANTSVSSSELSFEEKREQAHNSGYATTSLYCETNPSNLKCKNLCESWPYAERCKEVKK
jgi:hypothetical protein